MKPKKPQSNKSVKPAPVNIDKPEAYKLPDEITYKGIAFKVRQNRIGVGKQISDLSAMLKDDIYINQLFIARTPEFSEYMTVLSAVQQIAIDLRAQEQKLKDSDPRQKKALQQVIDKIKSDYNTESINACSILSSLIHISGITKLSVNCILLSSTIISNLPARLFCWAISHRYNLIIPIRL